MRNAAAHALLSLLLTGAVAGAQEVPRTHWAYAAIQRVQEAGIRLSSGEAIAGPEPLSRAEMASIVAQLLDAEAASGAAGRRASRDLEALAEEFRLDLAVSQRRLDDLEALHSATTKAVDEVKMGRTSFGDAATRTSFRGLVSVALLAGDDGPPSPAPPGGGTPPRTRYAPLGAQTFFTLPQASLSLDHELSEDLRLHLQWDYSTDAPGTIGVGGGVGINEAFVLAPRFWSEVALKAGGFALPFQSWEFDGPFRTATATITPSALGTFLEGLRPLGVEASGEAGGDRWLRWRGGLTTGADRALTTPAFSLGAMSDGAGLGALGRSPTFDEAPGMYLDLEAEVAARLDLRVGWFDLGGQRAPTRNPGSQERRGWVLGLRTEAWGAEWTAQYLTLDLEGSAAGSSDHRAWYALAEVPLRGRDHLAVRWDEWKNTRAGGGSDGHATTLAISRELTRTSRLQLEWLRPDEGGRGPAGAPQAADYRDDTVQLRYKVWF